MESQTSSRLGARAVPTRELLSLRTRFRAEMACQIVHDSIPDRPGWTVDYLLESDSLPAGFGTMAVAGPWKDRPTILEFYVLPEHQQAAFGLFEVFLTASGARLLEVQTSNSLLTIMLHLHGQEVASEKIVFADGVTTSHPANGASLVASTPEAEVLAALERRQGGGEWQLRLGDEVLGSGGILFHYNRPYGDIYMDIAEPYRRRGWGTLLVQELKRICYGLGAVPCARCNTENTASRRTLVRAGFLPCAHILNARIARTPA